MHILPTYSQKALKRRLFSFENSSALNTIFYLFNTGFCPSEAELQEVLREMEDPQQNGYIHIDRFYPIMTKILMEQK